MVLLWGGATSGCRNMVFGVPDEGWPNQLRWLKLEKGHLERIVPGWLGWLGWPTVKEHIFERLGGLAGLAKSEGAHFGTICPGLGLDGLAGLGWVWLARLTIVATTVFSSFLTIVAYVGSLRFVACLCIAQSERSITLKRNERNN